MKRAGYHTVGGTWIADVTRANLAPSVHNTQIARWHFAADHTITILANLQRMRLPRAFFASRKPPATEPAKVGRATQQPRARLAAADMVVKTF